jgi:hypothetical protein
LIFPKETDTMNELMSYTINVSDLTDQDALHRVLLDMQSHGISYSLVQNGVEVAKIVPVEREIHVERGKDTVSPELIKKREAVFVRMDALSKKITRAWSTDETAVEAITNDRNASDRR